MDKSGAIIILKTQETRSSTTFIIPLLPYSLVFNYTSSLLFILFIVELIFTYFSCISYIHSFSVALILTMVEGNWSPYQLIQGERRHSLLPGIVASQTDTDRRPFTLPLTLPFTPMGNLQSPVNITCMSSVRRSWSTQSEPTHANSTQQGSHPEQY